MKISKLFHWLYAFVMFLPIFAIGITCGYAMFNKNAYQSYNEETKLILVDNSNQLEGGNRYRLSTNYTTSNIVNNNSARIYYENVSNLETNYLNLIPQIDNLEYFTFTYYTKNYLVFYDNTNTQIFGISLDQFYVKFDFDIVSSFMATETILPNSLYKIEPLKLDNIFYYSVEKVTQSPLFSWSYNSFLAQPLVYIVTLFSIPANHIVVQLLSYWLAISIIWLVFDLIMYVPLLVHRWLDKGVLE